MELLNPPVMTENYQKHSHWHINIGQYCKTHRYHLFNKCGFFAAEHKYFSVRANADIVLVMYTLLRAISCTKDQQSAMKRNYYENVTRRSLYRKTIRCLHDTCIKWPLSNATFGHLPVFSNVNVSILFYSTHCSTPSGGYVQVTIVGCKGKYFMGVVTHWPTVTTHLLTLMAMLNILYE